MSEQGRTHIKLHMQRDVLENERLIISTIEYAVYIHVVSG